MAKNSIDFSTQLPNWPDPVSPNGGLLVAAGETQGQGYVAAAKGTAISEQVNTNLAVEGGKQVLDAAKGYLESGVEKDIKSTVNKYETATKYDAAVANYNILSDVGDATPQDLEKAKADIEKYRSALDQGTMTREQALLSIEKTVKDYSNVLPGYASDLRKLATTITGVEHASNYREFSLLSQHSTAEKLRDQELKNQNELKMRQLNAFVDKYKRLPTGGLNGPDMNLFRQEEAVKARAEDLKASLDVRGRTLEQNEPAVHDLINTRMSQGILTLNQNLQGIVNAVDPKTGKIMSPENKILLRQQILSDVGTFFEGLKAEVLGLNSNQLSNQSRETILNRIGTQQKDLVTSLQNQDSFDDFSKTMKIGAEKAADVMNKWSVGNPHLKILKESGLITPDVSKLWIDSQRDPKRASEFVRIYGKDVDDFYRSVAGQGVGNNYSTNAIKAGTDPEHLDKVAQVDPGQYKAQLHILRDSIVSVAKNGWGETTEVQDVRKKQFGTWLASFANQIDPSKPDMVDQWGKLVSDANVAKRIKELPEQEQLKAISPIYMKTRQLLEDSTFGMFKRLGQLQREASDRLSGFTGTPFEVVMNPITNLFEVKSQNPVSTRAPKEFSDITNQGAAGYAFQGGTARYSTGGSIGNGEVKQIVETINRGLTGLNNFKDVPGILPEEMQKRGVNTDYFNKYQSGYFNLSPEQRTEALNNAHGGGPVKTDKGTGLPPVTDAQKLLETTTENIRVLTQELSRKSLSVEAKKTLNQELSVERQTLKHAEELTAPKE